MESEKNGTHCEQIRPLADEVKTNGHVYRIVKRQGSVSMYEQFYRAKDGLKSVGYEVFVVDIRRPKPFKGHIAGAYESFPKNSDFGYSAYAPSTLELANKRLSQLIERQKNKPVVSNKDKATNR